jgi:UDPglucose--hexose-1-phosphate uridylyltransferase
MPELRKDYVLDRYVIIATERGKRPHQVNAVKSQEAKKCFFCPGNESDTPPEIYRVAGKKGWKIRVFANKFPAVADAGNPVITTDNSYYTFADAIGRHEVIVETPDHEMQLADLDPEHIAQVLDVYKLRHASLLEVDGVKYVAIFKNSGE